MEQEKIFRSHRPKASGSQTPKTSLKSTTTKPQSCSSTGLYKLFAFLYQASPVTGHRPRGQWEGKSARTPSPRVKHRSGCLRVYAIWDHV